ncbi:MAG: RelA/SpoT family protein, partial [Alphaproteobacteria bacterium]
MMRQYELVERVMRYNPNADESLLNKAYVYAMQKHGTQQRANGDPYFSHPLEVAGILTDLKLDDATIAVALLHDTIEDTDATRSEIDEMFGEDIGQLVEGLTKIQRLDLVSRRAAQAENLRKLLLAISSDVRVLLVKLADRLHNMRTLEHMSEDARGRISEETLEIYAPLAGRMGMHDMREEMEELSFRTVNPEAYAAITARLDEIRRRDEGIVATIEQELMARLGEAGIEAIAKGRAKRPYSIFRKMERKTISFEQLSDIIGFRVIVGSKLDCYAAVGVAHTNWRAVPGRFKDYISTPKQNEYQSIHTTVVGPGSQRVELQVRTAEMHRVAEFGIAAHALYKDGVMDLPRKSNGRGKGTEFAAEIQAYEWLRRTVDILAEGDTPEEFLEHTKLELFHDQVFCFTPNGRLIALPSGAKPIDFAYAVHTDVGDACVGAKINGRGMPLMTELHNGDEVEIITAEGRVPPAAWESMVVTGKARSAIRRATRSVARTQYAGVGRDILKRCFARAGRTLTDEDLVEALPRLSQSNLDDMLVSVGRGDIPEENILKAVYPDATVLHALPASPEEGWFGLNRVAGLKFKLPGFTRRENQPVSRRAQAIPIRGIEDKAVKYAAGGALPGERIVGIMTQGEGITIYPIQSTELKNFDDEPERWLDVRWDIDAGVDARFPARIEVTATNEPGT